MGSESGFCSRCWGETDGAMTCARCKRRIGRQAIRLGTFSPEEVVRFGLLTEIEAAYTVRAINTPIPAQAAHTTGSDAR